MKITLKLEDEMQEFELIENEYLFSYFFRFDKRFREVHVSPQTIHLTNTDVVRLEEILTLALDELIDVCYMEPSLKERQKHSTYFEKFVYKGRKYVVNYATSTDGRLIYTLNLRRQLLERARILNGDLIMVFSTR
jgi:hypothetical protein